MDIGYTVDHKGAKFLSKSLDGRSVREIGESIFEKTNLVSDNLALGIVLEMTVTLETAFNKFPKFGGKGVVVKEVVDTETRT